VSDDPIRLQNAQRDIRDAYFDHDSGLYTLNCVPGAGKSEVTDHISAEDILRRYVAGDPTPEQRVAAISFNRSEAENIIPDICARLREIVEHDLVPAASQVSDSEVEYLIQRINQAPFVGTIDSILRDVLSEIASDIGFEEMPVVGNTARQKHLHKACYRAVQEDPDLAQRVERLEDAYPTGEYDDDVSEMLETAVTYCRDRRISTERFRSNLEQTVEDVYAEGRPRSFNDVVAAVEHCVGKTLTRVRMPTLATTTETESVTQIRDFTTIGVPVLTISVQYSKSIELRIARLSATGALSHTPMLRTSLTRTSTTGSAMMMTPTGPESDSDTRQEYRV